MLNFYMDESGQDAKKAPLVVVGGFAIEAANVASFEEAVKAHFLHCFGIIYDGSYELKGKDLLNTHKFLDAYTRAPRLGWLIDQERQHHCQIFMQGQPQIKPVAKDFVAKAQAGILFVEGLADLLEQFGCSVFACMTSKEVFKRMRHNGATVNDILQRMEARIFKDAWVDVFNTQMYFLDKTDDTTDLCRTDNFLKTTNNIGWVNFLDSKQEINIQIADIISFCVNWGLELPDFQGEKLIERKQEISNLKLTKLIKRLDLIKFQSSLNNLYWLKEDRIDLLITYF